MTDQNNKLIGAYDQMLARVKEFINETGKEAQPYLERATEYAKEKAVELGELSREEAEDIANYLRRDIHDAATFLGEHGDEITDWLRLDLLLIENKVLEMFSQVVDQTRLELDKLAMEAELQGWHTGQVTGIGTLQCLECGEQLHFHKTGHIPPCPKCNHTEFTRVSRET
jgi:hypothetical protein